MIASNSCHVVGRIVILQEKIAVMTAYIGIRNK